MGVERSLRTASTSCDGGRSYPSLSSSLQRSSSVSSSIVVVADDADGESGRSWLVGWLVGWMRAKGGLVGWLVGWMVGRDMLSI